MSKYFKYLPKAQFVFLTPSAENMWFATDPYPKSLCTLIFLHRNA